MRSTLQGCRYRVGIELWKFDTTRNDTLLGLRYAAGILSVLRCHILMAIFVFMAVIFTRYSIADTTNFDKHIVYNFVFTLKKHHGYHCGRAASTSSPLGERPGISVYKWTCFNPQFQETGSKHNLTLQPFPTKYISRRPKIFYISLVCIVDALLYTY